MFSTVRCFQRYLNRTVILSTTYYNKRKPITLKKVCVSVGVVSAALYTAYNFQNEGRHLLSSSNLDFIPKLQAAKVFDPGSCSGDDDKPVGGNLSHRYNFIADVVEKIAPGVVYIEIQGRHPFSGHAITVSNGSGFIVREDGLILTNAHVVANKDKVLVKLYDGRVFTGVVQTADLVADLATIKIDCKNLPVLNFGTSNKLRPGEWVVAMGSPLSLSNTITAGVISSVHRESRELGLNKNMDYIQTDASITFGNSGGPLVNLDGEVIGINTMKVTAGISFAIPSDYAKQFLLESEEAMKSESGRWFGFGSGTGAKSHSVGKRRYMGITMLTLTPSIIQELQQRQENFPRDVTDGVLVWKVVVGSPAYNGGLHPGDVVVQINDTAVKSSADVYNALEKSEKLKMIILRKQQKLVLTIVPQDSM